MKEPKSRVQSLDRAINILEALSRHEGVGVTELAAEVGLHVATAHNLLTVLLSRNYVLNDRGTYRLGPALAALTSKSDSLLHLAQIAQPHLEEITSKTGESAVAAVLSGTQLVMIATTASADGMTCPAVNQVFPSPLNLATGRLLAAFQPKKNWPRYVRAYETHERPMGRTAGESPDEWESFLSSVREAGTCFIPYTSDSGAVAAAIRDEQGVVVAALGSNSVGRLSDSAYRERWTKLVLEAARRVSADLGYAREDPEIQFIPSAAQAASKRVSTRRETQHAGR